MSDYFDSHAHFDDIDDVPGIVERARAAGVTRIVAVGGSPAADAVVLRAAERFPGVVLPATGLGRDLARELALTPNGTSDAVRELERLLVSRPGIRAVGEIGLDFHYEPDAAEEQIDLFRAQLELARRCGLPVIVHSRDAADETLRELRDHIACLGSSPPAAGPGVVHCFTGSVGFARELLAMGYSLGFSGIITFASAGDLREVLKIVPDDRLLIETDSPYLAPVPHRGRKNEPAYLPHVAATVAEVRGTSPERIADLTGRNAANLFG